jgi:hypothetical protein
MLSTGLFTAADSYSQGHTSKKLNVDGTFVRAGTRNPTMEIIRKCPAVDKFSGPLTQKTARKAN